MDIKRELKEKREIFTFIISQVTAAQEKLFSKDSCTSVTEVLCGHFEEFCAAELFFTVWCGSLRLK